MAPPGRFVESFFCLALYSALLWNSIVAQLRDTVPEKVENMDLNDHAPTFLINETRLEISESAPYGVRFQLQRARDPDSGSNAIQGYRLSENYHFRLDIDEGEDGGIPVLHLVRPLDREKASSHRLLLTAVDAGNPARSGNMTITIEVLDENDNAPEIKVMPLSSAIPENSEIGSTVALLSVHDKDSGQNGKVICFMREQAPFTLNLSSDNKIYSIVTNSILDREHQSRYDVTITAIDAGTPPLSSVQTITVYVSDMNDNSPVFPVNPLTFHLMENNVPGSVLFTVNATDSDEGYNALVTYSIERKEEEKRMFLNINSESGAIYALKSFDYEMLNSFQFQVMASDSGSPSLSSYLTVNVFILDQNDNPPVVLYPVNSNGSAEGVEEIPRNVHAGHLVTKVPAYDADAGDNGRLLFSLLHVSDYSLFGLDRYLGEIRTLRSFTESDEADYKLVILVKDHGDVPLSATATLLVKVVEPKEGFPDF